MRRPVARTLSCLAGAALALAAGRASGGLPPAAAASSDLTGFSLEELMSMEVTVTSAAKRPQRLGDAAAAMFVLTGDEIRRAGIATLPDAFRLVPGLQVGEIDTNTWAITSRGFNGRYANKLLVMVDGRTVYTPVFSGVFWEREGVFLEDIDRIEVIRGPGASLWGANAVNGVINIITKPASQTQGGLITGVVGTMEQAGVGVRYGGRLGEAGHMRVYAESRLRGQGVLADGTPTDDRGRFARTGFRSDLTLGGGDTLTLQGDLLRGSAGGSVLAPTFTPPYAQLVDENDTAFTGNLLGRWSRRLSDTSHVSAQAFYQYDNSDSGQGRLVEETLDIEVEHGFTVGDRHSILWGGGARRQRNNVHFTHLTGTYPDHDDSLYSLFVQDEITLLPNTLTLTLGSKVERNAFTGVEVQPTARIAWRPHAEHTLWAAVSRAVRTPSNMEDGISLIPRVVASGRLPTAVQLTGNPSLVSEKLIAYEVGWRFHPTRTLSADVAAFYNDYSDLRSFEMGTPVLVRTPVPHFVVPMTAGNMMEGQTWGVETAAEWDVRPGWRLRGAYSVLKMNVSAKPGSADTHSASEANGGSPRHQFTLRSSHELTADIDFDVVVRAVDRLPALNVPGYVGLDMRVAWRPVENWEVALTGRNLLGGRRQEFTPDLINIRATRVERSVFAKLTHRF